MIEVSTRLRFDFFLRYILHVNLCLVSYCSIRMIFKLEKRWMCRVIKCFVGFRPASVVDWLIRIMNAKYGRCETVRVVGVEATALFGRTVDRSSGRSPIPADESGTDSGSTRGIIDKSNMAAASMTVVHVDHPKLVSFSDTSLFSSCHYRGWNIGRMESEIWYGTHAPIS